MVSSAIATRYCFCGHPEHADNKCNPRVGVTCRPHAFRETRSIMDLPTWSWSCLACGEYHEGEAGEARPVQPGQPVRCAMCGSSLIEVSTGRLTGGHSGLGAYHSTGRTFGAMPTLGGVSDYF